MATFDIPERYLASAPIIITSPTTRCGTTLVQRLLSDSDNAFIYGEEVGNQITTLTNWFFIVFRHIETNGAALDADFQRALGGMLDDWRPGMMAPSAVMMRAWLETYFQLPASLWDYGRSIGRPIWGFKLPACSRDTIRALLMLMPRAKVVYVFRNPFDALKSAKARKFVRTKAETIAFCGEWAKNMSEVSALRGDGRVLFLKYEDLIDQQEEMLQQLKAFTAVQGFRNRVFDVKINTFEGDEINGHSPTQYIEPAKLTEPERAAVLARTGSVLAQHYPQLRPPTPNAARPDVG